jgi:COP9 signalosome complex subunit 6
MLPVAEHLTAQHSAIKMLHSRVKLVLQYVRAVQAGELPKNHEILREAYSLSHRLPVLQSSRFRADFYNVSLFIVLASACIVCSSFHIQGIHKRMVRFQ